MQRSQTPRNTGNDFPARQLFLLGKCILCNCKPFSVACRKILTVNQTGIVRLAEPIALTSIFPYAWSLIKQFQVGKESDASFYAGLLISAFSLTEAMMGMFWGSLSDRIGRKPVLLLGCAGTTASLLLVGFAPNFWFALAARALGGMLVSLPPFWFHCWPWVSLQLTYIIMKNGNIGVIQTMVAEIVTRKEHERKSISEVVSYLSA